MPSLETATTAGQRDRVAAQEWGRYLDWEKACIYLSVSRDGLYRLVHKGLPTIRLGRGSRAPMRFDRLRVDAWMDEQGIAAGAVHTPRG